MDETEAGELLLRWRQGQLDEGALYEAVRGAMRRGARRGIASITSSDPDPRDVEDAVYDAFVQLRDMDPAGVSTVIGLARQVAYRRGQDIGRDIVRQRKQDERLVADPLARAAAEFRDEDARAAAQDEKVLAVAYGCFEHLTEEQRDLIKATIMGPESLSDWALRRGKSHQAASRQRMRGIKALKRCIDSKRTRSEPQEGR